MGRFIGLGRQATGIFRRLAQEGSHTGGPRAANASPGAASSSFLQTWLNAAARAYGTPTIAEKTEIYTELARCHEALRRELTDKPDISLITQATQIMRQTLGASAYAEALISGLQAVNHQDPRHLKDFCSNNSVRKSPYSSPFVK
jgi:hypothetical protein